MLRREVTTAMNVSNFYMIIEQFLAFMTRHSNCSAFFPSMLLSSVTLMCFSHKCNDNGRACGLLNDAKSKIWGEKKVVESPREKPSGPRKKQNALSP